jgi:hypothetical protein
MNYCKICINNNIKHKINDNIYKCNNNVNKIINKNRIYFTNIFIEETLNIKLKKYKLSKMLNNILLPYPAVLESNLFKIDLQKNKKKFICEKCNKNMTNKRNYIIHVENNICEKDKKKISCEKCDRKFTNRRSLKYHMQNKVCNKNIYNYCENKNIINTTNNINKNNIENSKIQLNKFKKKSIPLPLKRQVWNTYIGEEIGKSKCLCCKLTDITQLSFSCGHIIPESKGGKLILHNLKPICQSCNSSMGTNNMDNYMQFFNF